MRAQRRRRSSGDPLATYCIFDLLVLDGRNVMGLPALERKELLRALLRPAPPGVRFVDYFAGEGMVCRLFSKVLELKLQGLVAKRFQLPYLPGERTHARVKVKRPGAVHAGRISRRET